MGEILVGPNGEQELPGPDDELFDEKLRDAIRVTGTYAYIERARNAVVTILCEGTRIGMNRFNNKRTLVSN